ncbi:hypothetical protein [Mesorhizobium sp. M0146]|uniref:hypothetical protein n=1 Tax=unclassified Mesorhizobium TaxID=325217 RepID=UPI0033352498
MTDWIERKGGECPVDPAILVDVRLLEDVSRSSGTALAGQLNWSADVEECTPIIAYRIHKESTH